MLDWEWLIAAFFFSPWMELKSRECSVNLTFQKDLANLTKVKPKINSTKSALSALLIIPGSTEKKLAEKLDSEGTVFDDVTFTKLNT